MESGTFGAASIFLWFKEKVEDFKSQNAYTNEKANEQK